MQFQSEERLKYSDDLVRNDHILVGGLLCVILDNKVNNYKHRVLRCSIVGAKIKKRNQLTVIFPDQTPVITYV